MYEALPEENNWLSITFESKATDQEQYWCGCGIFLVIPRRKFTSKMGIFLGLALDCPELARIQHLYTLSSQ